MAISWAWASWWKNPPGSCRARCLVYWSAASAQVDHHAAVAQGAVGHLDLRAGGDHGQVEVVTVAVVAAGHRAVQADGDQAVAVAVEQAGGQLAGEREPLLVRHGRQATEAGRQRPRRTDHPLRGTVTSNQRCLARCWEMSTWTCLTWVYSR